MATFEGDDFFGDPLPAAAPTVEDAGADAEATTEQTATPAADASTTTPVEAQAETVTTEGDAATAPPASLGADVEAALRHERLPSVPGETRDAALLRLYNHQRGKSDRLYHEELRPTREQLTQASRELAEFKEAMTPMLRAWYEQQQLALREQQMAAIPDKETDPVGYNTWLLERQIEQQAYERQYAVALAEQQRIAAEENERLDSVLSVDEEAYSELETALTTDPEVQQGVNFAINYATRMAQIQYPGAPPEKIQELVGLSMQLNMRNAKRSGISMADLYKAGLVNARELLGAATQAATATNGNGNGHAAATTTKPAQPAATAKDKVAQAQAKARAKAVVSPTPAPRSTPSGDGIDFSAMSEEEQIDAVLDSPAVAKQYAAWFNEKFGKNTYR